MHKKSQVKKIFLEFSRIFMVQHQNLFQHSNFPKSYLTQIRGSSWHNNKIKRIRRGYLLYLNRSPPLPIYLNMQACHIISISYRLVVGHVSTKFTIMFPSICFFREVFVNTCSVSFFWWLFGLAHLVL
jgi:hypothetical protein